MGLLRASTRRQIRAETRGSTAAVDDARPWRLPVTVALVTFLAVLVLVWVLTQRDDGPHQLLVRTDVGEISLIDPATGAALYEVPDAVATPDRSAILTTRPVGSDTILESRDPSTGAVTGATTLDGADLMVRTVSPASTAVALMPHPPGDDLYEPRPRESTELTVAFLDDRPALHFSLDGNIEPEMFSLDDTTLFVLEFVPPSDPTGYHVKKLDLATGAVTDTVGHEVDLNPAMRGRARAQAMHPDGTFLYTLYTLPSEAPVHDDAVDADTERWAFVHVISLAEKWSHCVFLPVPFGTVDEAVLGMAVDPDGDTVVVVDPSIGQIAELDTRTNTVSAVHQVEKLDRMEARAAVAVADDGTTYVGVGSLLIELDGATYEPLQAWSQEVTITSLSVAGSELRIGGAGAVTLLDRNTRQETGVIASADGGTLELLGPPRGSVTEFPLECAC